MDNLAPGRRAKRSPGSAHASFVPALAEKFSWFISWLFIGGGRTTGAGQELPGINHPASTKHRHSIS
jgi:hypothetical protein